MKKRWKNSEIPVLLAQVPELLKKQSINHRDIIGQLTLKEAIIGADFKEIQILVDPDNELTWALAPRDLNISPTSIFSKLKSASHRGPEGTKNQRFKRVVWRAFTESLEGAQRRFLSLSGAEIRWEDVDADDSSNLIRPFEIKQAYISDDPSDRNFASVSQNVNRWCAENCLDFNVLLVASKSEKFDFWIRLGQLPQNELARISIPGDLVHKLTCKS